MQIAIGGLFSNSVSTGHLDYYIPQVVSLKKTLYPDTLKCLWVEGDSTDGTNAELHRRAENAQLDATIIERNHHGPVYRSVENAERLSQLGTIANGVLENFNQDILLWAESDLIWDAETAGKLIDHAKAGLDVVAPFIAFYTGQLYDIWAFRIAGQRCGPFPPYHPLWVPNSLMQMDSVGSFLAIKGEYARRIRFDERCLPGFCEDVRSLGGKVWMDNRLKVVHPKRSYDP
jgi:hypothetical protein